MSIRQDDGFNKKLFQVVREINISQDKVINFLESKGFGDSIKGAGLNAEIVEEEAYLILRKEYADDVEAAARIRELNSQKGADSEDGDSARKKEKKGEGKSSEGGSGRIPKVSKNLIRNALIEGEGVELYEKSISDIIEKGEGQRVEFKETIRYHTYKEEYSKDLKYEICKEVCGFMNSERGGIIIVGVNDEGKVTGLERDGYDSRDKVINSVSGLLKGNIGKRHVRKFLDLNIPRVGGRDVLRIDCYPSGQPAFYKESGDMKMYVRVSESKEPYDAKEIYNYIVERFLTKPNTGSDLN